jgi:hypothetical protein
MNTSAEKVIEQTKSWIIKVIVANNFCPFAAKEMKQNSINYIVVSENETAACLQELINTCELLDRNNTIETSFIILPNAFKNFDDYLDVLEIAEELLVAQGYEGIYQLASFHPQYCFEGVAEDDAANYTNRSIYPMFHLLREASIEKALAHYPNPEKIPETNIDFARKKGLAYMQLLRESCL